MEIPYQPIRVTDGIPEYWKHDIDFHGHPDLFGIWDYLIIESYDKEYVLEYKDELNLIVNGVYIHRYDRIQRFTCTLFQFIGRTRVIIPRNIIETIRDSGFDIHPDKVWNSIRAILKRNGEKKFYNRIPCILKLLGYDKKIKYTETMIFNVQSDFMKLHEAFANKKKDMGIKYFPHLRYIALTLMETNGFTFEYKIPKTRVKKIEDKLDLLLGLLFQ